MKPLYVKTSSEQVADHLRNEILVHTWAETIPGEAWLASELSIGRDTVKAALSQLEKEGLLSSQGAGRPRRIETQQSLIRNLRVRILLYESTNSSNDYIAKIRHQLELLGHTVAYASKSLLELRQSPKNVAALVSAEQADAWIILSGSRPVLKWFSECGIPAFALFGRFGKLPIAAATPDKTPAMLELANWLVDMGHRRIVMLVRKDRRKPHIGDAELSFLHQLESRGIPIGTYNIPDWEDNATGFHECLESLFKVTPPTALYIDTVTLFYAAQHYLAQHPKIDLRQISITCADYDPLFEWCEPAVTCIKYDLDAVVRRVVDWANRTSRAKNDIRQTFTEAKLLKGGSVKPPFMKK